VNQREIDNARGMTQQEYLDWLPTVTKRLKRRTRFILFLTFIQLAAVGANYMTMRRGQKFRDQSMAASLELAKKADEVQLKTEKMKEACLMARGIKRN
jgi:hypothetical protein